MYDALPSGMFALVDESSICFKILRDGESCVMIARTHVLMLEQPTSWNAGSQFCSTNVPFALVKVCWLGLE